MTYPYFGFTNPAQLAGQQSSNPFMNAGSSYLGAMPAGLGGVGASPMASVQSAATPNMSTLLPIAQMGMNMMNQNRQQPGAQQRPSAMQQLGPAAMAMAMNPQLRQGMQGLMGTAGGSAAPAAAASAGGSMMPSWLSGLFGGGSGAGG